MIANPRTVADRAANYFGVYDEPRRSVRLGNDACFLVVKRKGRFAVMHYSECSNPRGTYQHLTDKQAANLIDALSWSDNDG